jgi:hypothetical protein
VGVGVGEGVADGEGDGEGDADGDGLGEPEGVGVGVGLEPLGVGVGVGDADADELADVEDDAGLEGEPAGVEASATGGRGVELGRVPKNRGGRLKVGTSSQKGARGSSVKYRLLADSATAPLTSIRNGPISQSAGMARAIRKRATRPGKNSRKPSRLRRRSSSVLGSRRNGKRIQGPA